MPVNASDFSKWLIHPTCGHVVEFYPSDAVLLHNLTNYIAAGLSNNESCIVIASAAHIAKLNARLSRLHPIKSKLDNYISLEAETMLKHFMVDGLPNRALHHAV